MEYSPHEIDSVFIKKEKTPGPAEAGIVFSLMAILQIYGIRIFSSVSSDILKIGLSEVLFIALPPILFTILFRYHFVKTFRFQRVRLKDLGVVLLISPVATLTAYCAGILAITLVRLVFGSIQINGDLGDVMNQGLPLAILAIGIFPAICEELMFRGFFQRGMEGYGGRKAVILSGVLFGLFHFDFQRLAAQMLLGIVIAYVVYRTGSIVNGIIIHFLHNAGSVMLTNVAGGFGSISGGFFGNILQPFIPLHLAQIVNELFSAGVFSGSMNGDVFSSEAFIEYSRNSGLPLEKLIQSMAIVSLIILVASLFVLFGLLLLLRYTTEDVKKPQRAGTAKRSYFIAAVPGLVLILLVYVSIGFNLLNMPAGEWLMKILRIG